jgi:hypothetical protein
MHYQQRSCIETRVVSCAKASFMAPNFSRDTQFFLMSVPVWVIAIYPLLA